jgi:hypothetical protein
VSPSRVFPAWFEANGTLRENGGFDGVIGNPPWEALKPIQKEFAYRFTGGKPELRQYSLDATEFEKWFSKEMSENEKFRNGWEGYQTYYRMYKDYLAKTYLLQGTSDWNLYKLFVEATLRLLRLRGRQSLLVQSGFHIDEGTNPLRHHLLLENLFEELTVFENRGYAAPARGGTKRKKIFPDVDPRFKFGYFKLVKGESPPEEHAFDFRAYIHDPKDVIKPPIRYSLQMVRYFSPENFDIMEFRNERDLKVCSTIRDGNEFLVSFGFRFRREFHATDDKRFLHKLGASGLAPTQMPLYEGKTIFQFDNAFSPIRSYVTEDEIREELLRKEISRLVQFVRTQQCGATALEGKPMPKKGAALQALLRDVFAEKGFKLHYELDRLAYREIGSSTNERSLIAAIIPARACMTHKLMYLTPLTYRMEGDSIVQVSISDAERDPLLALFNSLTLNYYVRNKISTGVSVFQLMELPIPKLTSDHRKRLAESAVRLSAMPDDLKERARLEVFIARDIYRLDSADWAHLTSTFTFGGESDSKADLNDIIRLSHQEFR